MAMEERANKRKLMVAAYTLGCKVNQYESNGMLQKFKEKGYKASLKHFRPPQGRFDERTLKFANQQNLKTVMWSLAIKDWGKTPIDSTASANLIAKRIHPGAIILFHITNSGTPKMLRELIAQINQKGYNIANANEI